MKYAKGAPAPFFLALCTPRLRDDALLNHAVKAFQSGHYGDALLAVEYVCRRFPNKHIPAILRAKVLQACRPELVTHAWYRAWTCEPEDATLQDAMLRAWLQSGAAATVAEVGPAFLPARCRAGTEAGLLDLLGKAGLAHAGACWRAGDHLEGSIVRLQADGAPAALVRLWVADEHGQTPYDVAADGARFRIAPPRAHGVWSLSFSAAGGPAQLMQGSPIAFEPAALVPPATAALAARPPVAIVVPVYRGRALVQACIDSVLASFSDNRTPAELIVVDDASPEPELSAWLDGLAEAGRITLLRNRYNLGFIETINRGLRHCPGHDALLLNADTLVHGDWIDRLAAALYSAADIASVTPWSNNGEISSFPTISVAAPAPSLAQLAHIDTLAAQTRAAGLTHDIELPSCCGFAMLMRRSVIDAIGILDGVALIRGYGEEVDWCMRARGAGYRHLAATGVFVAHTGTVSFRFEKTLRVRQNRTVLTSRYPGYYGEYHAFIQDDPLQACRRVLADALRAAGSGWPSGPSEDSHDQKGIGMYLPAPLNSSCIRIALFNPDADPVRDRRAVQLARLLAAVDPAILRMPVRLLLVGQGSEALWRTGMADIVPPAARHEAPLLSDAMLAGLGGCRALLSFDDAPAPAALVHARWDDSFDPVRWLAAFLAPLTQAAAPGATPKESERA